MNLIVLTGIIVLMLGLITLNSQYSSGSSGSDGSSSSSDNEDSTTDADQDNNLVSESLVIMQQDRGVGLYRIVSDETDLDTGIQPKTIRLVNQFSNVADALSWLSDYDNFRN